MAATERRGQRFLELLDGGHGPHDHVDALASEAQPHGSGVGGVVRPLDEAGTLQRTGELGDVDRLQAGDIGKLALAGPHARA